MDDANDMEQIMTYLVKILDQKEAEGIAKAEPQTLHVRPFTMESREPTRPQFSVLFHQQNFL